MPMTLWRRRRRTDDLRPTWAERQAALESVRERLRRQGAEERRQARIRRAAPGAALLAFAIGAGIAAPLLRAGESAHPELFAPRRLAVVGTERLAVAELAGLAGTPRPVTPDALAARLESHPWIASARATRVSPDTLVVRIVERVPAAIWLRGDPPPLLLDASGAAFAPADDAELPRLRLDAARARPCPGPAPCPPDPRLATGVALARAVERAGYARPEIELDGPDPRALPALRLAGLAPRVLLGAGDVTSQLERLGRVLAEVPASREAGEIDLRFTGQVVVRPPVSEPDAGHEASAVGVPPAPATGGRPG